MSQETAQLAEIPLTDPGFVAALEDMRTACQRRDKRALYAAAARAVRISAPGKPVNIEASRVAARCMAADMFGWEIQP